MREGREIKFATPVVHSIQQEGLKYLITALKSVISTSLGLAVTMMSWSGWTEMGV